LIYESTPWKERLAKDADLIDRWSLKRAITARRSFLIEQKVFLAAYAMRKLLEANKLSSSFSDRSLPCKMIPSASNRVDFLHKEPVTDHYDFAKTKSVSVGTRVLLNLIIHSYIFVEALREDFTIEGFYVTSDQKRHKHLIK
jgi:hypothetical protein